MLTQTQTTEYLLRQRLGLTSYIACVTRNYHLAEDVYQEICVKALSRDEVFETADHLISWFRVCARNRAIDVIRSREGRYVGLSVDALSALEREWDAMSQRHSSDDRREALAKCMQSLTPRSREIVKMRYFENRSCSEVAAFMGSKIESAYQAIARIHKSLGQCVRQQMEGLNA
ncbi:RNA polymerase sigma factor [Allorhodopirellula heiligendammensis]|uniref:RNA polymerase sigma factor n=1 Tax=Allorhodopirellula heiligendammensis TaxID=2714739 RepID=A0A5C6C915_9BACT|nr:sigma-70 family RNA polymerase sigma factor [Allorhodopirellula heiligendammensis]TWU19259.1 RNA polymerase sigma factor [Allorhodopirellula heiligendammensis]